MARKIVLIRPSGGDDVLLSEEATRDEAQLQELMKENPDLLPIDEFGMTGPLVVVGRETTLPSGAIDLVAIARSGEILLVEFKTGPQNTDFRQCLAQLLDYGSDLWQVPLEQFQTSVAHRYFASDWCVDPRLRGKAALRDAAHAIWTDLTPADEAAWIDRLNRQLSSGAFHYVVVAQRFVPTVERTVEYLNAVTSGPRFYAVELVRFAGDGVSAFESRTVLKPSVRPTTDKGRLDETLFLEGMSDEPYQRALRELLETCRTLGLRFDWGSAGTSIRIPVRDRREPLTIGWLFPPGTVGWMGLSDLTLGFDPTSAKGAPSMTEALDQYLARLETVPGAKLTRKGGVNAYHLGNSAVVQQLHLIIDILGALVQRANREG